MNSTLVRKLAYFAVGAVIGGIAGYVTGKFIADRFLTDNNGDYDMTIETEETESEVDENTSEGQEHRSTNGKTNKPESYIPVDYSAIRSKPNIEDIARKYAPVKAEDVELQKYPYVITLEQYEDECPGYEEVSLIYYAGDDTLSDRQDEIVTDRKSMVGLEWLEKFGFGNDDKDIVYVRNDRTSSKFEISRVAESYKEVVGGDVEEEEDEELKPKPSSRKGKAKKNGPKVDGETSS